ncbi:MAG: PadR family transcriptional regulator [Methyloligellaceae bacterium]
MDTKTLCLGILTLGDSTGYDIRKSLDETFSHFMEISPSGVYPALRDMEDQGFVTSEKIAQDDRPNKIIYSITNKGRDAFVEGLAASPGRHKVRSEMLALIYFAEYAPEHHLLQVLEARKKQLEEWTALTDDWCNSDESIHGTLGQHFISKYALAMMCTEINFLDNELPKLKKTLKQTRDNLSSDTASGKEI